MSDPLMVLLIEDSEDDALLVLRELQRGGFTVSWERVETAAELAAALKPGAWDVIISDYRLPGFDSPTALEMVKQRQLDLPFIVVSGTIGETAAVAMMKAGAHDYLMKDNLTRLPEAVRREVRESQMRMERRAAELRLHQTAKHEQLMRTVTERIRRSLDLDAILTTTVTEVRQVLQTDRVILFKLNAEGQGYVAQESVDPRWRALLGQDLHDPCLQTEYVEQYLQGRVRAIADIDDGSIQPCHANFLRQLQVRANLVVPIIQSTGLWGLLIAHHCSQPRPWAGGEIQLLLQLADQVAIAIQQANLYRQAQLELAERQRAEAALQQLNQELEQRVQERTQILQQQAEQERLLRLIIQNIHRSLALDDILPTVLHETRQTLQTDRVAIFQFSEGWIGQVVAEAVGDHWQPLIEDDMAAWDLACLIYQREGRLLTNEPIAVEDIDAPDPEPCPTHLLQHWQARAYAIAPMMLDGKLWGLMVALQNTGPRPWQVWEVSLLQQIGVQMAIAFRQSRLYQAAQEQVQELEKLHRLKDDFLSTVSHELRSPLANIKMAIQMLELSLEKQTLLDERLTRYLQILEECCTQELTLINDLLDLQKLEAGAREVQLEPLDLRAWLPDIAAPFVARAQERRQRLSVHLPPDLPTILTDVAGLKRIVMELLHNACKYTPPNEEITVTVQRQDATLHLEVCNSGVELSPAELPHLFEKFYRVASVDRWKHGGTGLGLALVKHLVEHLNGTIEVNSANALTCFTVELPLKVQSIQQS